MRYLLDSQSALWSSATPELLSPAALAVLRDRSSLGYLSVVTPWELGIKVASGKLLLDPSLDTYLDRVIRNLGLEVLPVTLSHARRIEHLPVFADHKDPFDRMLVAQALVEGLPIVSSDAKLARYGVAIIW